MLHFSECEFFTSRLKKEEKVIKPRIEIHEKGSRVIKPKVDLEREREE